MPLIRDQNGASLLELMVAMASATVILASTFTLLSNYAAWQNTPNGKAELGQVMAEFKKMTNLDDPTVGPNASVNPSQNCRDTFGAATVINTTLGVATPYNLYNSDGSVHYFGTPTVTQNLINPQWRITSITLTPFGLTNNASVGQRILFANLTVSAAPVQNDSGTADKVMPLAFVLDGANTVVGCSSASIASESVVKLPGCAPGQHLIYYPLAPTLQPTWRCILNP